MKNKLIKLFCIFMMVFVAGCAQDVRSTEMSPSVDQEYQDTVALVTDPYGPLLNSSASTNTGYYELLLSADAAANNILYTDFTAKQRIYLCSAPNCTHDNDACTSWTDYTAGGSYLFTSLDGQKLYYIQRGMEDGTETGEKNTGKIFIMNADGSEKKILLDIGADGRISDAVAADSRSIYVSINTVDSFNADPQKQLWRIDASTGAVEVLSKKLPAGSRIFGAFDTKLIFQEAGETRLSYKAYDLKTRTFEELISWDHDAFEGSHIVYGHRLFVLKKQDIGSGELEIYDLRNMERTTVQNVPIYFGDTTWFKGFYDDQTLIVDVTDNSDVSNIRFLRYKVDIVSGAVTELTLACSSNGYMRPISILCEAQDSLLVQYETYTGTIRSAYNGQPMDMQMIDAPRLGLISKSDYFSSTPNFTAVADHVISE